MKKIRTAELLTPFAENIGTTPRSEYPRPTMVRDSYLSLNGEWKIESSAYNGKITVPFPPESVLSGIGKNIGEALVYKKTFSLPKGFDRGRVLLHFGAVDAEAKVFLNGKECPLVKNSGSLGTAALLTDNIDWSKKAQSLVIKIKGTPEGGLLDPVLLAVK